MSRILRPFARGPKAVAFDEVTKSQLARAVNEQAATIKRLDGQLKYVVRCMIALSQSPEAFKVRSDGVATIEAAAVDRVRDNTDIHITPKGGVLELRHTLPEDKGIVEVPHIVMPDAGPGATH